MTKDEKEALKSLTEHRGFKILEQIVEDKRQWLYTQFENIPLWDAGTLEKLSGTQNYIKGMKYLIDTAKAKTQEVVKAKDMS